MSESASITKFIMSFFQFIPWLKTIRHLVGILLIVAITGMVYVKFFKKDKVQNTTFRGDVGEVNIISDHKKTFIPYVEGGVGKDSDEGIDTYIRTGLRFEW